MFEFGRDLRKLFERARESDDLGWLELIGADLVESEARSQGIEAGRVSCVRPHDGWMRAAALWREHARRTGRRESLDRAVRAADDAARQAQGRDQVAAACLEAIEIHLAAFDLYGGPERLDAAEATLPEIHTGRPRLRVLSDAAHARIAARRAQMSGAADALMDAAALFDAVLQRAGALHPSEQDDLRLERAASAMQAGVMRAEARLLDQAGRDLRLLVETCTPEQRPITRARALAMAGLGLKALAGLARDDAAIAAGQAMFAAAADQFTPDHSPLDWTAVCLAGAARRPPLMPLRQAEALTQEPGLILGALVRERRVGAEVALAASMGDLSGLGGLERSIKARLKTPDQAPLDWAADQIGLAHVMRARAGLIGAQPERVGMMLAEAALTARELGAVALADRAESVSAEIAAA